MNQRLKMGSSCFSFRGIMYMSQEETSRIVLVSDLLKSLWL